MVNRNVAEPETSNQRCACGCGQFTKLADRNYRKRGIKRGDPYPFVVGHNPRYQAGPKVGPNEKWCGKCKTVKPKGEFFRSKTVIGGLQNHCKVCTRATTQAWKEANRAKERRYALKHRLRERFGLTLEDYDAIVARQGNACAICKVPEKTNHEGIPRLLSIDHDHVTGRIRGLLCNNCNRGLGLLGDSRENLQRALTYLL